MGDDTKYGLSRNTAWISLNKINTIDLEPGDRVLFEGGSTLKGSILLDEKDLGRPGHPVILGVYGKGKVTIDAVNTGGILIHNASWLKLVNLIVKGTGVESNALCSL